MFVLRYGESYVDIERNVLYIKHICHLVPIIQLMYIFLIHHSLETNWKRVINKSGLNYHMRFDIKLPDGRDLCIQFVKRGKTVYIRQCAYTFEHPTPAQQTVRNTLALGATKAYDGSLEQVNLNVETEFRDWVRRTPENRSRAARYLREIFPDDTRAVEQYLEAQ